MIQPGVYNLKVQRRADYSILLGFKDSNQTPLNLTGWQVYAQIWDQGRSTKYADFTVEYVNRSSGEIKLKLPYNTTTTLPPESVYDVLLLNASGEREYYLEGSVLASEGYSTVP